MTNITIRIFTSFVVAVGMLGALGGCTSHKPILVSLDGISFPSPIIQRRAGIYIAPETRLLQYNPGNLIRVHVGEGFVDYTKTVMSKLFQSAELVDQLNIGSTQQNIDFWILGEITDIQSNGITTCMIKAQWTVLDQSGRLIWKEAYASIGEVEFPTPSVSQKCLTKAFHNHFSALVSKLKSVQLQ